MPDTPTVTLDYDNLGNRTGMTTAGVSSHTYAYDSLSELTSENVNFNDLSSSNYTLSYSYELGGGLKSITDPFSAVVSYTNDKTGRPTTVSGSGFASVSTYASGIEYRAFGGLKQMTYGSADSSVVSYSYDNALRPNAYQSTSSVFPGGYVRRASYDYLADGKANTVSNAFNASYDETYKFDHMGRITSSTSGNVTNDNSVSVTAFGQSMTYDAFSNNTSRYTSVWGSGDSFTASYTNDRKTGGPEVFDASGNIIDNTGGIYKYDHWIFDAAGRVSQQPSRDRESHGPVTTDQHHTVTQVMDGDGAMTKRDEYRSVTEMDPGGTTTTTVDETLYYVRSSVLGGAVITEIDDSGNKKKTHVLLGGGGSEIAAQIVYPTVSFVVWRHTDPVTGSYNSVDASGGIYDDGSGSSEFNAELEPLGESVPTHDPSEDSSGLPLDYKAAYSAAHANTQFSCVYNGMLQDNDKLCNSELAKHAGEIVENESDTWVLGDLGIALIWGTRPTDRPHAPPANPDTIRVYTDEENYISGYYVWGSGDLDKDPNRDKLKVIADRVKERVKSTDCAKLVNRLNVSDYLDNHLLIGTVDANGKTMSPGTAASTHADPKGPDGTRPLGRQSIFNENSYFFTGQVNGISLNDFLTTKVRTNLGIGDLNVEEFLELIVIHELAHANDIKGEFNDAGTPNPKLNSLIVDSCFKRDPSRLTPGGEIIDSGFTHP